MKKKQKSEIKKEDRVIATLLPLTIANDHMKAKMSPLEALQALQKHLMLTDKQAADWMNTVCDARC